MITLRYTVSLITQDAPNESQGGCYAQSRVKCSRIFVAYPAPAFSTFSTCFKSSQSLSRHSLWSITPYLMMACLWWGVSYFCVGLTDASLSPRYTIVCKPSPASRRLITTACKEMRVVEQSFWIARVLGVKDEFPSCRRMSPSQSPSGRCRRSRRWTAPCRRTAPALLQRSSSTTSIRTIGPDVAVPSLKSPRKHLSSWKVHLHSIGLYQAMAIGKESARTEPNRVEPQQECNAHSRLGMNGPHFHLTHRIHHLLFFISLLPFPNLALDGRLDA